MEVEIEYCNNGDDAKDFSGSPIVLCKLPNASIQKLLVLCVCTISKLHLKLLLYRKIATEMDDNK